ncbi:hypothetical protein TNCV_2942541 [Trichonephila clavipes]|nr:hypothetical protein TNCV_2942541 [Trichonephila clavipes]
MLESVKQQLRELALNDSSEKGCGGSHTQEPVISRSQTLNGTRTSTAKGCEKQKFTTEFNVLLNEFGIKCLLAKSCNLILTYVSDFPLKSLPHRSAYLRVWEETKYEQKLP